MLKYKKGKFLFIFAQKRAFLVIFVKFPLISCSFSPSFLTFFPYPFYPNHASCHSTLVFSPKTNLAFWKTRKNPNFPPFFKFSKIPVFNLVNLRNFQKFHFSQQNVKTNSTCSELTEPVYRVGASAEAGFIASKPLAKPDQILFQLSIILLSAI